MTVFSVTEARREKATLISLFSLTMADSSILRFTSDSDTVISFGGNKYAAIPVDATGFAWNDRGAPIRPSLSIANQSGLFSSQLDNPDLIGQRLMRTVTFIEECDAPLGQGGGSSFTPECWKIERLARLDADEVVFDLVAEADLDGKSLPSRVMLRDLCQHRYRIWDHELQRFDYSQATCPYVGIGGFDRNGNAVANGADDSCSLELVSGCKKRFSGVLPFMGFPGIGGF